MNRVRRTFLMSSRSFQGSDPERFKVDNRVLGQVVGATAGFVLRGGSGAFCLDWKPFIGSVTDDEYAVLSLGSYGLKETSATLNKPKKPLILYDLFTCPFCKKTREALAMLDLDYEIKPCPRDGPNFRKEVETKGGKQQFPYLIDPNTGKQMYESSDIIDYVFDTYGPGSTTKEAESLKGGGATLTAALSSIFRGGSSYKGSSLSKLPKKPLVIYGYEASPFSAIVLAKLSELEIPYLLKSCARGSSKRQELKDKTGFVVLPYIEDPNNNINMFESADIIEYLEKTYA